VGLGNGTNPGVMDDEFPADIRRAIIEKSSEPQARISSTFTTQMSYYSLTMMFGFLLVSLNINATPSELALDQKRKELDEITKGGGAWAMPMR